MPAGCEHHAVPALQAAGAQRRTQRAVAGSVRVGAAAAGGSVRMGAAAAGAWGLQQQQSAAVMSGQRQQSVACALGQPQQLAACAWEQQQHSSRQQPACPPCGGGTLQGWWRCAQWAERRQHGWFKGRREARPGAKAVWAGVSYLVPHARVSAQGQLGWGPKAAQAGVGYLVPAELQCRCPPAAVRDHD